MELPALDSIRNTARIFETLRAPTGTSCALQAGFLQNVLVEYETIQERRTSSRSHVPAAPVDLACAHHAQTHAQTIQRPELGPAHDDQSTFDFASEDASSFDMGFANDEAWALMFANAGFNIGQGAFLSAT